MSFKSCKASFTLALCFAFTAGCASYQNKISEPRKLIKQGQTTEALVKLKELSDKPSDDQLVYLLEYGTALQIAGQYKESNEAFLKADRLTDLNDFHSVTNIVGATLGSETMIQYKGESYEKFLINAMLAINFLMLNQRDDALVEARRINDKLSKMKMDGREPYELSPFSKYLSALIWESDKKYDDAYIAFEESYKLDPTNPLIGEDLIRSAKNARRDESYKKWKSQFPQIKEDPSWYDKSQGEVILIFQQGWGPEKKPMPGQYRYPTLVPVWSETQYAELIVEMSSDPEPHATSRIYDIEGIAVKTLREDYGSLIARRVGGVVAKAVVADQFRQKDKVLGELAWIAMNLADQADLRQWSMLPQTIQLARAKVKPGEYKVRVLYKSGSGALLGEGPEQQVTISANKKVFLNYRSLR